MKAEEIINEKAIKYFCYFDENQKKAIYEAMITYSIEVAETKISIIPEIILKIISEQYKLDKFFYKKVYGERNVCGNRNITEAAQLSAYFINKYTKLTLQEIAAIFKKKNHATIISSLKRVNALIDTEKKYKDDFEIIKRKIHDSIYDYL